MSGKQREEEHPTCPHNRKRRDALVAELAEALLGGEDTAKLVTAGEGGLHAGINVTLLPAPRINVLQAHQLLRPHVVGSARPLHRLRQLLPLVQQRQRSPQPCPPPQPQFIAFNN